VLNILSHHPSVGHNQHRLDAMQEKVNLELMLSQSMRSRTGRYDETEKPDIGRHWNSSIDMNSIVNQTLTDMEQLQQEKDQMISELTKRIEEKDHQIEELTNRASTIKHYSNLLIRSSNLYVNKNINEITETDKVSGGE
jgi:predicted RNase H-like nuclease (RuvC/YqgF family)